MVRSALENSLVYVSFVPGHFVHLHRSCIVVKMQVIPSSQLLCCIKYLHLLAMGLSKRKTITGRT